MPQSIRAVVVDPSHSDKLTLQPVELPAAAVGDVTVRVTAISLNRGEVNRALSQPTQGARPGWDFVGLVEEAAADGTGPQRGTRVVGMLSTGAWAESAFVRRAMPSPPCRLRSLMHRPRHCPSPA
jgi:NADPH:quinone reductase-like Zn-dependent oxidoreductase